MAIAPLLALEKLDHPRDYGWIVYTYVIPSESEKIRALFIPLDVVSSEEKARKRADEIIRVTEHRDVLIAPYGRWISLGDPDQEDVTLVEIKSTLTKEESRFREEAKRIKAERERIIEEIRKEQALINENQDSIESFYYDWHCAVQNDAYHRTLLEDLTKAEEAYKRRIDTIKNKLRLHPEYEGQWQTLLMERLSKRGEADSAKFLISAATEISAKEGISVARN